MGIRNSSDTRVRPVFDELLDRQWNDAAFAAAWLGTLWRLAEGIPGACPPPQSPGLLRGADAPRSRSERLGTVFERRVAPPGRLLAWMLRNPDSLTGAARQSTGFGCSGEALVWRRLLFSGDQAERAQAQAEGLDKLDRGGPAGSRHQWWAFEGFSALDCCLVTDRAVIVIEGKRTERVSSKVLWYPSRNQLWRNVEAAQTLAGPRTFGVIVGVETDDDGKRELDAAMSSLDKSCPHLLPAERTALARHLLGYVTWKGTLKPAFGLPDSCFPETVS